MARIVLTFERRIYYTGLMFTTDRRKRPGYVPLFFLLLAGSLARLCPADGAARCGTPPGGRWCGININTLSNTNGIGRASYDARDFAMLEDWGFNFTRLTLDYRLWIKNGDWNQIDDNALRAVDRGVALGRAHHLHVMLNFHRAPGHCCCEPYEATSVFVDAETRRVCARHWAHFARRYRGIPNREVSFNLFNEPPSWCSDAAYAKAVREITAAIRSEDPDRLVVADGLDIARKVPASLLDEPRTAFAFHGYDANPEALFAAWDPVLAAGKMVFMGEMGVTASVPRQELLAQTERYLQLAKARNMGWALWEIRGGYGVINSCRPGVSYEDLHGEKYDRELLELLQRYASAADGPPQLVHGDGRYNSWPMLHAVGRRLVCAYSRGWGHDIFEGHRGMFVRHSDDFGQSWSEETCIVNDPSVGEVGIGKGSDASGRMLLWIRSYSKGAKHHDLYRTADGVRFERLASPQLSPMPMQITDIFAVPGIGLMSLWFAGGFTDDPKSWGTLVSADDGLTWRQRTVETVGCDAEWPTEPSAVYLGNGRILAIARTEDAKNPAARQFQLTSTDYGATWKRTRTNIGDICYSTPSLVRDSRSGLISNYYYERGKGLIKRRVCRAETVFDHPQRWPEPSVIGTGSPIPADSGNANATVVGGRHFIAYYSGKAPDTSIYTLSMPAPERTADNHLNTDKKGKDTK